MVFGRNGEFGSGSPQTRFWFWRLREALTQSLLNIVFEVGNGKLVEFSVLSCSNGNVGGIWPNKRTAVFYRRSQLMYKRQTQQTARCRSSGSGLFVPRLLLFRLMHSCQQRTVHTIAISTRSRLTGRWLSRRILWRAEHSPRQESRSALLSQLPISTAKITRSKTSSLEPMTHPRHGAHWLRSFVICLCGNDSGGMRLLLRRRFHGLLVTQTICKRPRIF